MDRSLSTIDTTVIHSLSLPPPVAPSSRSFSLSPSFISLGIATFHRSRDERKFKLENRVENELEFPRLRLFQRAKLLFRWKRGLLRDRWTIGPWFNYAICQPIIFDPRFAGLSRFSRCRADYRN